MLYYSKFKETSWLRWSAKTKEQARVCIMGIPFDNAVSLNKGASKAPEHLRLLSRDLSDTTDEFKRIADDVLYDLGDLQITLDWNDYFQKVEQAAYQVMKTGNFALFLGGDHSVTIPLHKAFGRYQKGQKPEAKIGILHFDAHYDLCDEYDGHKWSHACTEARALEGVITDRDLTFAGVRVAEEAELDLIKENPQIQTIRAMDVHDRGADRIAADIISYYEGYDAIYLTLDIDVLDPAFAPGTGTPVSGGLTSIQLIKLIRTLLKHLPICAMDIVEVAPPLDVNDITSWAALRIIHEVLSYFSNTNR